MFKGRKDNEGKDIIHVKLRRIKYQHTHTQSQYIIIFKSFNDSLVNLLKVKEFLLMTEHNLKIH